MAEPMTDAEQRRLALTQFGKPLLAEGEVPPHQYVVLRGDGFKELWQLCRGSDGSYFYERKN